MKNTTGSQEFYNAYKKMFKGHEPDYLDSVEVFVSSQILEQAIAKVGLDREKIRQAVNTMTFDTVYGKIKFDGVQNSITPAGFAQIQKGKIEVVWPKQRATSSVVDKGAWAK
jgi:branched-chain amino acid transport system substrate-binding protein